MEKRFFQTLDEMNLHDTAHQTRLVAVSSTLLSADKVKQGTKISMGADERVLFQLASNEVIPILLIVDKDEYFKREKEPYPQTLLDMEKERFSWSLKTFPKATALSSLEKLSDEIVEVANELQHGHPGEFLAEEYADCLMCLFDSAGRAGLTLQQLIEAFAAKLEKNKNRIWVKNDNNTYSHVK